MHHAPSISGSSSMGRSMSGAMSRPAAPSYGSHSIGTSVGRSSGAVMHSPSMGHSVLGGAGLSGSSLGSHSGFAQRHFSGASSTSTSLASHTGANRSGATGSLVNHSVSRPSFGTTTGVNAGARHGVGGFGNNGHNIGGFNHGHNGNYYNHPSRQTSYFFGFGSPFGSYWGYPGYSNFPYYYSSYWSPWYRYGSFGLGYGYGGYGYGGYGYGVPSFGYQSACTYNNAYYLPTTGVTTYSNGATVPLANQPGVDPNAQPPSPLAAEQDKAPAGDDFATLGEQEFHAGKYDAAVRNWRHALVDEPGNGGVMMLLAQALFATSQYDEAAGAVQLGMQMVPVEKWGTVVEHYRELYPKIGDYTTQLRALEKARDTKADDPALRFLLGYHYGFLGYPKNALQQLDKCVELAPKDEISQKLQQRMKELLAPKAPGPVPAPPTPGNAASNATPDKPAEAAPTTPTVTAEKTTP